MANAAATAPAVQDSATARRASLDQARSTARWANVSIDSEPAEPADSGGMVAT